METRALALFQRDLDRNVGAGKAERLRKRPVRMEGFFGLAPLSEDGIESARVQQLSALPVVNLEQVVAESAFVDCLRWISRPIQWFEYGAIQTEPFFFGVPGV